MPTTLEDRIALMIGHLQIQLAQQAVIIEDLRAQLAKQAAPPEVK